MVLPASEKSLQARAAALSRWARETDRSRTAIAGFNALLARFAREVDPDEKLPEEVRAQRARALYRAHMLRLAAKSAATRRARKQAS